MAMLFRYKDMKAQAGQPVFQSVNSHTAMRETVEHIRAGRITPTYAADFALYQVGEEDPDTLRITALDDPKHIIDCEQLLKEIENG